MNDKIRQEVEALKGDFESKDLAVKGYQYSLARQIKNEIGDDIEGYFNPPPPPKKDTLLSKIAKKLRLKKK